jgi:hypothetical protein
MTTLIERFNEKWHLDEATGCWIWDAYKQPSGYANLWNGERVEQAHRISYRLFVGEIPRGTEIDHRCRNRACVNPEHLRAVTHRENMRVSDAPMGRNAAKLRCKRGHPLSGTNLVIRNGTRQCRECLNRRARRAKFWRRYVA